ncbi:hypothetical protein ACOSQ3_021146 [Xanthoceras sorbifolium]
MDKLIISTDFIVLDMDDERAIKKDLSILLGRPFMMTVKMIIDVQNEKLFMTVLGETVEFQVFDYVKYPLNSLNCFHLDVIDAMVEGEFTKDELEDLLELERELEEEEKTERQRLGSAEGEDGAKTYLGVKVKKKQLKAKAKHCRNKPRGPKPNLEERAREEELQLLSMGSVDLISDSKWLRKHLAGHPDDNALDVH